MSLKLFCPKCQNEICIRANNINLALGYVDEQFCLKCLSTLHNQSIEDLFDFIFPYIKSRDCFKKEWNKMKEKSECPLPNNCVTEKCFSKGK